jgi:transcription elongation factor GreA
MIDQPLPGIQIPPAPTGPIKMTRRGREQLEAELSTLADVNRPALVNHLRRARLFLAPEDGSVTVSVATHDLATIDRRIKELTALLERVQVIPDPSDSATVQIGSRVRVRYDDGAEETLTIVGPSEADLLRGSVSSDSPAGEALLGKAAGDKVSAGTGDDDVTLTVVSIGKPLD